MFYIEIDFLGKPSAQCFVPTYFSSIALFHFYVFLLNVAKFALNI